MIEAIHKIDPQLRVRYFLSLEEFAKWIRVVMEEGAMAIPKGGTPPPGQAEDSGGSPPQLALVVSKNEFLGTKHMALLRKTRELFIKKGLCTAEDPTSLVITSFENPDFDIKLVEDRIINNVIFKPFDKLILQQHLTFAIDGRHPPSQYSVHKMKTSAAIEMLKEVQMESISDVGFISISNRPIAVGSLAKYYSPSFISLKHKSMMALCYRCDPHPEIPDQFRCGFTFLAADPYQITNIRKEVRQKDAKPFEYEWYAPVTKEPVEIAFICKEEELRENFKYNIEKSFLNVKVHLFSHLQEFVYAVDPDLARKEKKNIDFDKLPPVPGTFHAIFGEESLFEENFKERWQSILETVQKKLRAPSGNPSGKTELFLVSKKTYSDSEERALGEILKDIFFLPMDSIYVSKKLMVFLPQLSPSETFNVVTIEQKHLAKAASPIEISEFSEAGLVMKYYRPISAGAFREFVLWLPHELDLPEFLATCNFSEESKNEKSLFFNHFVFFGMSDHFLKHIRRWILQNHVASKESESA